jgi:acyl transferase domain-containing protein
VPVRNNLDGKLISGGHLSEIAAATLLTNLADWRSTVSATMTTLARVKDAHVTIFGLSDVVSTSTVRNAGLKVSKIDISKSMGTVEESKPHYPADAIAIVGMACKYAGADSTDELWEVVRDGRSMHEQLPETRWSTDDLRRTKKGTPFWGNFVHDIDAFDHRFFKKSSREAAAMDPQQRLLLQTAYQTVESSGYFGEPSPPTDVGCYIGVATTDYHDNISSQAPTAFSALGELRAFLCGRISYYFGWTGPSLTYDTACSSSIVAVDAACKAIQSGQCSRALAGGVSANTSPYMWENLRSATFLSQTGQTKPFDANADGYCRGEGVGLVFLKKLSDALNDGDNVQGVIPASGVNQCMNETYITVPHGPSQVNLYEGIMQQAGLKPNDM